MHQVATRSTHVPRLGRFSWLMALYAENFQRMTRLFEPADLVADRGFRHPQMRRRVAKSPPRRGGVKGAQRRKRRQRGLRFGHAPTCRLHERNSTAETLRRPTARCPIDGCAHTL